MVQLRLPGYEGPLELLLQLIESSELDISEVSLVQVADQYMDHLDRLRANPGESLADAMADFILIGGKLMFLKSKAMLPREVEPLFPDDDDADVGRELVEMLEEYKRIRGAADMLGTIDRSGMRSFGPGAPPPVEVSSPVGLPDSVTLDLLTKLVREAFARAEDRAKRAPPVSLQREPFTVKDKIEDLRIRLQRHGRVSFRTWIEEARTRVDVIVTFMAILELYKSRAIEMHQDEMYGDILVESRPGATEDDFSPPVTDAPSTSTSVSPGATDDE